MYMQPGPISGDVFRVHKDVREYTRSPEDRVDWSAQDYFCVGKSLDDGGRQGDAINLLIEAADKFPEDFLMLNKLARALLDDGKEGFAYDYALAAQDLKPNDRKNNIVIDKCLDKMWSYANKPIPKHPLAHMPFLQAGRFTPSGSLPKAPGPVLG